MKFKVLLMTFILASCSSMTPQDPKRQIASAEGYTPQEAIADALSGELKFLGWAILPGSDSIGSCTFANEKAYVIWHYCSKKKKVGEKLYPEMPAFNLDIISYDGQKVNFFVENSEKVEKSLGNVSKIRRSDYDANWAISYMPAPVNYNKSMGEETIAPGLTTAQLKVVMSNHMLPKNSDGLCFVGGMFQKQNLACKGEAAGLEATWGQAAKEFWSEPNEEYYTLIKKLRLRTSHLN